MTHKQNLLNVIEKEIGVIKTISSKVTKEILDYAPMEGMRTTLEVMQYLTWCGSSTIVFFLLDDPSKAKENYTKFMEEAKSVTHENFKERMDAELSLIKNCFENISDEDLINKDVELPWKEPMKLGQAIMETTVKWLTGYKMQMYLYMKQNGIKLDTGDCWIYTEEE
ncbi:MAG: hypothetical protein J0M18_03050 [Ignavibacteria bacterium]|nr:hypothetical protein [Ignavibacteria bacterium]